MATLHDGSSIDVVVAGEGPALLLPVQPQPVVGPQAEELRNWGADPALGRSLIAGLTGTVRVVAFGYEDQVLARPKPETLTPDHVAAGLLAVADAAGVDRFAYYGYSWLAAVGLQLAVRTDRLSALVMGGYPPLAGPYREMLRVTEAAHAVVVAAATEPQVSDLQVSLPVTDLPVTDLPVTDLPAADLPAADVPAAVDPVTPGELDWDSARMTLTEAQTRQFVTLYQGLQGFDDRAAQALINCPRLCFAGSGDMIDYGDRWGGVRVDLAGPLVSQRAAIEAAGWEVRVLDGLDHLAAMQAAQVLPILRPWLTKILNR